MKKNWKLIAIILAIVLVLALVTLYHSGRRAAMTAEAAATVLEVQYEPAQDYADSADDTPEETTVRYTYSASGITAEGSTLFSGDARDRYRKGQAIAVCYNPESPDDSSMAVTFDRKCGD